MMSTRLRMGYHDTKGPRAANCAWPTKPYLLLALELALESLMLVIEHSHEVVQPETADRC